MKTKEIVIGKNWAEAAKEEPPEGENESKRKGRKQRPKSEVGVAKTDWNIRRRPQGEDAREEREGEEEIVAKSN